jgi:hypothetical protein
MPYKSGKLKGQLTTAEIRKLIRGHNKLVNIKVPAGIDRDGLIAFLKRKNFEIDHENQRLIDKAQARGKSISLDTAKSITKPKPKTELEKQKTQERKEAREAKKKKEAREIKKQAIKEEKARSKPKAKPKPKTATIETQTEKPKPKKQPKKQPKKKVLAIQDKDDFSQEVKAQRCANAVAHAESIIRLYEKYNGVFKDFPDYKSKKEMMEDLKELKERNWGDCTQSEQAKIKKAIRVHEENEKKPKGKVKAAVEKIEKKSDKGFKVERFERTQKLNQLSENMGKKINPFKVLGIKASEETPELVKKKCRELRLKEHPDKGGDPEKFDLIQNVCRILLDTQTITKKNDKDKGEAIKKPENDKITEGWKKYFMIVEDNKELLKSNKLARGNPFSDSYDFYKNNADVMNAMDNFQKNYNNWIEIVEKKIKELKKKKPDKKIEDKKKEPEKKEEPEKKKTKKEIVDEQFDNLIIPELKKEVEPLLYDWLKNKDDQLYKKIKTFKMWKVPPVKDEETGTILKKGKKNPKPEYYKEKEKLLKEVKKRFTEVYKRHNFSTRGGNFNDNYLKFVDAILKGFGSKTFKIEADEKLEKKMNDRRKREFEQRKKERGK